MKRATLLRKRPIGRKTWMRRIGARALRQREVEVAFRLAVLARSGGRCERCGKQARLQVHHILPRSRGGQHIPENGAALDAECHGLIHDHAVSDWRKWIA